MSYPTWPSDLPQKPIQDGYQEGLADNTIRSKPDVGYAKVRRRSTAVNDPIKMQIVCTQAQWSSVKYFYRTTLAASLPFTWTHPSDGTTANFRFVTPPMIAKPAGIYVVVALDLEVIL